MRCSAWRWARLAGFSRHLASGRRRQAPVPVQGASTSTRSKRGPSAVSAPVSPPFSTWTLRTPARFSARRSGAAAACRRRRRRLGRCCAWLAANASVLPPAPAQISSTCWRGRRRPSARRSASPRPAPRTSLCRARPRLRRWAAGPAPRAPAGGRRAATAASDRAVGWSAFSTLSRSASAVDAQVDRRAAAQGGPLLGGARRRHARTMAPASLGSRLRCKVRSRAEAGGRGPPAHRATGDRGRATSVSRGGDVVWRHREGGGGCADRKRARTIGAHLSGDRSAAAQGVVDEVADGGAVARAGEAMALPQSASAVEAGRCRFRTSSSTSAAALMRAPGRMTSERG